MSGVVAIVSLFLTIVSLLAAPFGVLFAPFTFALFVFALVAVSAGSKTAPYASTIPPWSRGGGAMARRYPKA